jgi:short-subunit dehydrogenase
MVTGASSGIGAALALHYAAPGRPLLLWGRDAARLEAVAERCRALGALARTRVLDLLQSEAVLPAIRADDAAAPVAFAIIAAGLGDIQQEGAATERPEYVRELGLVNFVAATVIATALAERMAGRGGGRLGLIGSVAGFQALPFAAAYCGSKAGLARFAEALHHGVRRHGVSVSLISLGFVDTPMSRRLVCAKPLLLSPEDAARQIASALARGRGHAVVPWPAALLQVANVLPGPVRRTLVGLVRVTQRQRP